MSNFLNVFELSEGRKVKQFNNFKMSKREKVTNLSSEADLILKNADRDSDRRLQRQTETVSVLVSRFSCPDPQHLG